MGSNTANDSTEANKSRLRVTAFVVSLLMYLIFVGVNLDPAVTKAQVGVAGERPFGIPTPIFFAGLNAVLFFPIFWWTSSVMKLQAYANQQDRSFVSVLLSAMHTLFDLFSLFASVRDNAPADIRRARNVTFAGFVYFAVLAGLWIVLAARAGV